MIFTDNIVCNAHLIIWFMLISAIPGNNNNNYYYVAEQTSGCPE